MKDLVLHPAAKAEADGALAYYEAIRKGLGSEFRVQLEAALDQITAYPEAYAVEGEGARVCPLHRFPYSIVYMDLEEAVWVAAVAHQHRRPGYWSMRRP